MLGIGIDRGKRKGVRTREGQVMYMGRKYCKEASGYYACTTGKSRKRLHVAMWETEAGREVPVGCVIHHVDWNKSNNSVENLVCVTVAEHERIHNIIGGEAGRELGEKIKKERGVGVPPGLD